MTIGRPSQAGPDLLPASPLDPSWVIEPVWIASEHPKPDGGLRGGALPAELRARYAAPLEIPLRTDRPAIIANFVSTLDGVVALDRNGRSGGREISGGFEPDRFVMGLLRAAADAVLVGAATVRASRTHGWTPGHAHRASAPAFAAWRSSLGLSASPATLIVTASGALQEGDIPADPASPVTVITTYSGARRVASLTRMAHVEVAAVSRTDSVPVDTLISFLRGRGFALVLSEGGPTLFGELLAARAVDEVFLTVAPQLAGRSPAARRLSLVEGAALAPAAAPWARLRSVMRSSDHLFLRYRLAPPGRKDLS
jgi:riboflavin biosynthesis pyrimidine reductase